MHCMNLQENIKYQNLKKIKIHDTVHKFARKYSILFYKNQKVEKIIF